MEPYNNPIFYFTLCYLDLIIKYIQEKQKR